MNITTKNIKRIIYLIITALLLIYSITVIKRYISNLWNKQFIANYLDSARSTESKLSDGNKNCNCSFLSIDLDKSVEDHFDRTIDLILDNKVKLNRIFHFLFNSKDPYNDILLPKMEYFPSRITFNNTKLDAKIKLTGGLADHYNTPRRSLRIKLNDTILVNMSKFNLYNPTSRAGGIYEWITDRLMLSHGLISLNSGYLDVTINNQQKGIYFYQEQPTAKMLEHNKRPLGLLVRLESLKDGDNNSSLSISNYYDKKSFSNKQDFVTQQRILLDKINAFNKNKIGFDKLVSISKIAKFSAIIDLTNGYHGGELRNMYFYLNPSDSLLEPIGREFSTNYYFIGLSKLPPYIFGFNKFSADNTEYLIKQFDLNTDEVDLFRSSYHKYLEDVSNTDSLNNFFHQIDSELSERQFCLFKAEPNLKSFSKEHYAKNQILIREYLLSFE